MVLQKLHPWVRQVLQSGGMIKQILFMWELAFLCNVPDLQALPAPVRCHTHAWPCSSDRGHAKQSLGASVDDSSVQGRSTAVERKCRGPGETCDCQVLEGQSQGQVEAWSLVFSQIWHRSQSRHLASVGAEGGVGNSRRRTRGPSGRRHAGLWPELDCRVRVGSCADDFGTQWRPKSGRST